LLGRERIIGEEENDEETKAKDRQIEEGASRKRKQRLGNTCIVKSDRANIAGRRGRGDLAKDVRILDS
jgi:hypothetical protein